LPLVQHNNLPSIDRVQQEGVAVCVPGEINTVLPSINIGFLNMMPDAAISATERQFLRLVGANNDVNCYFYPFNIAGVTRSLEAKEYIDQYYVDYSELKTLSVDALVITGANVSQPLLQNELFWPQLVDVLNWAKDNVRSTLCSCLATHAAAKVFYGVDRQHLGNKCWGVFSHKVTNCEHRLVQDVQPQLQMCHSRFNDISAELFVMHGVDILIESEQVGVQLAAESDLSIVYFQGHPEYDDISLLKEYKREIIRYITGELNVYPPAPENYFNQQAMQHIADYQSKVEHATNKQIMLDDFPEEELRKCISNPWKTSASKIFSRWVESVAC